jgi:hypothetical protein
MEHHGPGLFKIIKLHATIARKTGGESVEEWIPFIIIMIVCGSLIGWVAYKKNRNVVLWSILGAFSFLVCGLIIVFLKKLPDAGVGRGS